MSDDIERAGLKLIFSRVPYVFPSYLGGKIEDVERAANQMATLRSDYASLEPEYMRKAVMKWLDFYDGRLAETRRDIETGESKRRVEQHSAQMQQESDRADALLASLNLGIRT